MFQDERAEGLIVALPIKGSLRVNCLIGASESAIQVKREVSLINNKIQTSIPLFPVGFQAIEDQVCRPGQVGYEWLQIDDNIS